MKIFKEMIDEKEKTIQFGHVADGLSDVLHSAAFHAHDALLTTAHSTSHSARAGYML